MTPMMINLGVFEDLNLNNAQRNLYIYQETPESELYCVNLMTRYEAEIYKRALKEGSRLLILDDNPISKEKMDKILLKHKPTKPTTLPLIKLTNPQDIDYSISGLVPPPCSITLKNNEHGTLIDQLLNPTPRKSWYCIVDGEKIRILWEYTEMEARIVAKHLGFDNVYEISPTPKEVEFAIGDDKPFDPIEEIRLQYENVSIESNTSENKPKKKEKQIHKDFTNSKLVPSKSQIAYVERFKIRCSVLDMLKLDDESGLGLKDYEIANKIGTSASTVYRVRKKYEHDCNITYDDLGEYKRGRKPNNFIKIPEDIYNHLVELFQDKVPLDKDINGYTWRASEVLRYLEQLGIHVSLPYFYKFCQRVGFTSKVATRKNPKQNDSFVDYFKTEGFLEIVNQAIKENREIVFMDQAGVMINHHSLRGYSLRGTPTMGAYSTQLGHVVSSICTFIGLNGFFRIFNVEETITSDDVIDMMEIIKKENPGKKFIFIIDNAGIHTSRKFLDWYFYEQRFCLIYYLPPYSPKLNVVEFFNNIFKQELRDVAVLDRQELVERARTICAKYNEKTPDRMEKVKSLFLKKECRYAKDVYDQVMLQSN